MRNTKKAIRALIFDLLDGNVSVPVYDEKKHQSDQDKVYILLSTQQETESQFASDCAEAVDSSIDIEIIVRTGYEVTKDTQDDIEQEVLDKLFPALSDGVSYSGFIFTNVRRQRSITRNLTISTTESVMQTIIQIIATTMEQS